MKKYIKIITVYYKDAEYNITYIDKIIPNQLPEKHDGTSYKCVLYNVSVKYFNKKATNVV